MDIFNSLWQPRRSSEAWGCWLALVISAPRTTRVHHSMNIFLGSPMVNLGVFCLNTMEYFEDLGNIWKIIKKKILLKKYIHTLLIILCTHFFQIITEFLLCMKWLNAIFLNLKYIYVPIYNQNIRSIQYTHLKNFFFIPCINHRIFH